MNITELLKLRGLDLNARIKMMRHISKKYDVYEMYRRNHFEIYQSFQSKPVLECDYLISFLGIRHSSAKFVGVYKVDGRRPAKTIELPPDYPYQEFTETAQYWYDLIKQPGYEDLTDRVVIDWGMSERSWHQWLSEKNVTEILPIGYVTDFTGYLDISISFAELKQIINNPTANREWHQMLQSVAGIYLILDTITGKQYVGIAFGKEGILGRWKRYAKTNGHGNNSLLIPLVKDNKDYSLNFQYTILHTLTKSTTKEEALRWEVKFKNKLGTKAFGLNIN